MKTKRKKKPKGTGKRGIYILPNLLTSASLFSGFFAIIAAIQGRYETAAIAILISFVFDGLDGKIARLTHSTSLFGTEYDSLSDLVAFGGCTRDTGLSMGTGAIRSVGMVSLLYVCNMRRLETCSI